MSIISLRLKLRRLFKLRLNWSRSGYRSSSRIGQWFKWLAPGLLVKRWLLISAGGVLLTSLGLAI